MVIKAALLDAPASSGKGLFLGMVEIEDESELTERHVPAITGCDLPPARYVWVPVAVDAEHPFGGEFVDKAVLAQRNAPDFETAFNDLCEALAKYGITLPPATVAYVDHGAARRKRGRK